MLRSAAHYIDKGDLNLHYVKCDDFPINIKVNYSEENRIK